MQMFEVGGCVRDEILGVTSKDIDFTVVLTPAEKAHIFNNGLDPFKFMVRELMAMGFFIFVETPEFLTVRGRFPSDHPVFPSMAADFVLARKESDYTDGRRPDKVEPGALMDDLSRRDFTMNAIAKNSEGMLIDPFGGIQDINRKVIRCVGDPVDRIIKEDALRGMRALRFRVTKGFYIDSLIGDVIYSDDFKDALAKISTERIQQELDKMFKVSTVTTLDMLLSFDLTEVLFGKSTGLRLMPTMKG